MIVPAVVENFRHNFLKDKQKLIFQKMMESECPHDLKKWDLD